MAELKPCPFCGGKPYMAQNYLGQKYVRCPECGACVWGKDTDDWRIATMGEKRQKKPPPKHGTGGKGWSMMAELKTAKPVKGYEGLYSVED